MNKQRAILPAYMRAIPFTGNVKVENHGGQPIVVLREERISDGRILTQFGAVMAMAERYTMPSFDAIDAQDAAEQARQYGCVQDIEIVRKVAASFGYPETSTGR